MHSTLNIKSFSDDFGLKLKNRISTTLSIGTPVLALISSAISAIEYYYPAGYEIHKQYGHIQQQFLDSSIQYF